MNALATRFQIPAPPENRRNGAMVEFLRSMVVGPHGTTERLHALYLDSARAYLGDTALGQGADQRLSLRMREMFERALALKADGIILAHNHPSGLCRPSPCDIEATQRIRIVAQALDIQLIDHLIFTRDAVYSMRAGGNL